jgi:hypothetical protein
MIKNLPTYLIAIMFPVLSLAESENDNSTFSLQSATLDKTIPEFVRKSFEDDNGKPMKSISVHLSTKKIPEKLIPNEFLCGSGGCPWVIYSPTMNKVIGRIYGRNITILSDSMEGFKSIEGEWRLGTEMTDTAQYKFHKGTYEKIE